MPIRNTMTGDTGFSPLREGEGTGGAAGGGTVTPPATWLPKDADPLLVGHAQNRGWDKLPADQAAVAALKAHREAEGFIGVPADRVIKLPADATDEAGWNGVYQRLGAPKDPKEYDTAIAEVKFSDGDALDQSYVDAIRNLAIKNHWSKEATVNTTKEIVKLVEDGMKADVADEAVKLADEQRKLATDWGSNLEVNKIIAKAGAAKLAATVPELAEAVATLEGKVGYTAVMKLMHAVGLATSEDKFIRSLSGGGAQALTKEQATARRAELQSDPDWQRRYLAGGTTSAEYREMQALIRIEKA